ncbi:MAG TPA: type I-U CRISPR-associated protein Csx17 [Vicinamibacterales bacterium]|nr:type I-U CRISPR-associated protein Csx17 [Vicinamibacterales bacterium]
MTKLHVHELKGLKPDALATYLGAVGVLRVLAEQKDPNVRGFWRDEHFVLVTSLDWEEIEKFFLEDYAPTPILAPWNMESGFFSLKPSGEASARAFGEQEQGAEEAEKNDAADEAEQAVGDPLLDQFASTSAERFSSFRKAIELARAAIPEDLRRAEEEVWRVYEEMTARAADQRAALKKASKDLDNARKAVEEAKALVEQKGAAAQGAPRGASVRVDLQNAQQCLKDAREREKAAREKKKQLEKELKEAERVAARDKAVKDRISEAKKRFKDVQSATKERLIAELRVRWGEEGQQWVDAAVALDESGAASFTSLFGSGGNAGRMEFTKNFRQHLDELFDIASGAPRDDARAKLRAALCGGATNLLTSKAVGQFFPGRAGGANMSVGFEGSARVNSWEFILMLEGAVALVAGMSRRGEVGRARVSSPFWVEAAPAGFGSASEREQAPRGEQWLPLWSQLVRYSELVELFREGRAQVGRQQATRATEVVRATARLGVARGIEALQRFAYLRRNGQANLAVFTGRFHVRSRSHQELVDEVAPWIDQLISEAQGKNVPASLAKAARQAQEALFCVCSREATPTDWRNLLMALGHAELVLLRSGKSPTRRPLPTLGSRWIDALDDHTAQGRRALRLALAFASQHRPAKNEQRELIFRDPIRVHFIPLNDGGRFDLDERGRPKLGPEQVCHGRALEADAIALVKRRSVWARSPSEEGARFPRLPLQAIPGCEATLEEVAAWIRGEVSDREVLALARGLLALDWQGLQKQARNRPLVEPPPSDGAPEPLHLLFRLAHPPFDVPVRDPESKAEAAVSVRLDPEPLRRLAAGDLDGALRIASRRLEASGLRPLFRRAVATPTLARRLAASLAFPVSQEDAARAARLICKPYTVRAFEELPVTPA